MVYKKFIPKDYYLQFLHYLRTLVSSNPNPIRASSQVYWTLMPHFNKGKLSIYCNFLDIFISLNHLSLGPQTSYCILPQIYIQTFPNGSWCCVAAKNMLLWEAVPMRFLKHFPFFIVTSFIILNHIVLTFNPYAPHAFLFFTRIGQDLHNSELLPPVFPTTLFTIAKITLLWETILIQGHTVTEPFSTSPSIILISYFCTKQFLHKS